MRKQGLWRGFILMLATVFIISAHSTTLYALTANSNNYQITETEFGAMNSNETCSGQYCARTSIGDMTGDKQKSQNFTASFEPLVDGEPSLDVIVEAGDSNLGVLSTDRTATKTTSVSIRSYLSGGYMLQVTGSPPKYGNHTLSAPSVPTASFPGTEQFAINAVANTDPSSFGAAPEQIPDNLTSFGAVEPNYGTTNRYKYTSGDVVGRSDRESGHTKYTISMIVNVSNETPAGHFTGDFSAVVIPIF